MTFFDMFSDNVRQEAALIIDTTLLEFFFSFAIRIFPSAVLSPENNFFFSFFLPKFKTLMTDAGLFDCVVWARNIGSSQVD